MDEGKEVLNQGKKLRLAKKKDLKLELVCVTYGEKYIASRERQHILTDKHKFASPREVKNNENIIFLNSQTAFPEKSKKLKKFISIVKKI